MTTALISQPSLEPVTLSEAKAHLRFESADEDTIISELITAARRYLEQIAGVVLITQSWRQYEDCWPVSRCLNLKINPVRSVQSITVYDADGSPQIVPPGDYQIDVVSEPARIYLTSDLRPGQTLNGIEVDFTAGFGDTAVDVPDTLKRAILLLTAHWFEFRGAVTPREQPVSIPPGFEALIAPFKRVTL